MKTKTNPAPMTDVTALTALSDSLRTLSDLAAGHRRYLRSCGFRDEHAEALAVQWLAMAQQTIGGAQ